MLKPAGNAKARLYGVGAAASYYSWNWMFFSAAPGLVVAFAVTVAGVKQKG